MPTGSSRWNFASEEEMWLKLVGQDHEDTGQTADTVQKIFRDNNEQLSAVLEIGAGNGRLLRCATHYADLALGVDYNDKMVKNSLRWRAAGYSRMMVIRSNGMILPFADESFPFVYSFTCFQHMEAMDTIRMNLMQAQRVLEIGGTFVMQAVIGDNAPGRYDGVVFESPSHLYTELFNAGFTSIDTEMDGAEWVWARARK